MSKTLSTKTFPQHPSSSTQYIFAIFFFVSILKFLTNMILVLLSKNRSMVSLNGLAFLLLTV
ncbi:MAG: hypothetical protein N3E48_01395 [Candidatus Bathyarchaeota archaeon]|nr:hypothetical protein [Candidatus Bathyarchaeota archaeon]